MHRRRRPGNIRLYPLNHRNPRHFAGRRPLLWVVVHQIEQSIASALLLLLLVLELDIR